MLSPPYALAPLRFPFPALAASLENAPLGGPREVCTAALQVARLVHSSRTSRLGSQARAGRAAATRSWLASMALPKDLFEALANVALATGRSVPVSHSDPQLVELLALLNPYLDPAARAEISQLVGADERVERRAVSEPSRAKAVAHSSALASGEADAGRPKQAELSAP